MWNVQVSARLSNFPSQEKKVPSKGFYRCNKFHADLKANKERLKMFPLCRFLLQSELLWLVLMVVNGEV